MHARGRGDDAVPRPSFPSAAPTVFVSTFCLCISAQVNLVHGSERNLSGSRRLGLAIRYLAPSCRALPMENEEAAAPWDQASAVPMASEVRISQLLVRVRHRRLYLRAQLGSSCV